MMNKKEQKYVEDLKEQLLLAKALRFTIKIEPDVDPPPFGSTERLRKGWLFNAPSERVEPACTSSIYHSFGTDTETRTQGARRLYSTKLLALMAMRNEIEIEICKKLARIDKAIEDELEAKLPL